MRQIDFSSTEPGNSAEFQFGAGGIYINITAVTGTPTFHMEIEMGDVWAELEQLTTATTGIWSLVDRDHIPNTAHLRIRTSGTFTVADVTVVLGDEVPEVN